MNEQKFAKYKTAFVAAAALIALLEIPGALDIRSRPYDGYWTDPNDTVIRVFPDSPAQQAGFAEGDRIISSGGIDMKDSKALARRPRAKISETRTSLTNIVIGVFLAGYLGLAAVAMVHSYIKATPQEQTLHGLNFMLLGTVVGLAPVVISAIVGVIAPKVVLPGVEYYGLTMVLIPLSLAYATLKKEKALAPDLA